MNETGIKPRGDFRRTSDIDLAVTGGEFERFALDVNEDTSTLLKYDLVDLNRDIHEELLEAHGYEESAVGSPKSY